MEEHTDSNPELFITNIFTQHHIRSSRNNQNIEIGPPPKWLWFDVEIMDIYDKKSEKYVYKV